MAFYWKKNNQSIKNDPNAIVQSMVNGKSVSILTIGSNGGSGSDLESYTCMASNMMGNSNECKLEAQIITGKYLYTCRR